jgi:homeobox protein cut-like
MWKSAHDTWKEVGLGQHIGKWDENYSQVICHKEHAVGERQRLVQVVREFTTEAKGLEKIDRAKVEVLLQHFKGTIHTLLERSKFSEDAFIATYQVVSGLQDPAPLLWSAHVELLEQQRVAFSLEQRLREAGRELELLQHQRREEKAYATDPSATNHADCEQREVQLRKALQDVEQRCHATQAEATRLTKALASSQEALMQANQMLSERQHHGDGMDAPALAEEDLNSVIATLERMVATLRGQRHVDAMRIGELETDLAKSQRKEEISTRVAESLRQEKDAARSSVTALEAKVSGLQTQLLALERTRMDSTNMVTDAHRNALNALQQLGWVPRTTEVTIPVADIVAKHSAILEAQTKTLQARIDSLLATSAASKAPLDSVDAALGDWSMHDSTVVPIEDDEEETPRSSGGEVIRILEDDPTLVGALTKQRDTLKVRLQISEHRCQRIASELSLTQERCRTAQDDNVTLYTRVQYLEDVLGSTGKQVPAWEGKGGATIQRRYDAQFNEKFSPFADWTKKQRESRYQTLSLVDRVALFFSASLLSSKYIRAFLVLYALVLHIVVFVVLAATSSKYTSSYGTRPISKNSF